MRRVYPFTYEEFNNILKYKNILSIISPDDLSWNIFVDIDKTEIETFCKNNISFALVAVNDDLSKYKVYFIVYVDDKLRLRAYIPQYGNLYNPWTFSHFGEESPYDYSSKSITKMPKQYYEINKKYGGYKETKHYIKDFEETELKEDKDLMIKEFLYFHRLSKNP